MKNNATKVIFIRGHQGSGKSTKAEKLKNLYKSQGLSVQHIENDMFLYDENNKYVWTRDRLKMAIKECDKLFRNSLYKKEVVIVSNVFAKKSTIDNFINIIKSNNKKKKLENRITDISIVRMMNSFENEHNVNKSDVNNTYLRMEDIDGEFIIEPIKPMEIKILNRKDLPLNTNNNSKVSKEYLDTYEGIYFTKTETKKYDNLYVLKYKKEVFFNNDFDDALLEMRGLIIDKDNNIIVRPFKKIFNYSEIIEEDSNYHNKIDGNKIVNAVVKVNGYLGVCTYSSKLNDIIYSTTGSVDSGFAKMTETHCEKYKELFLNNPDHTFCFEITDETDKHIIEEEFGETLIGCIRVSDGYQLTEDELDNIANEYNINRPERIKNIKFNDLIKLLKDVKHEGFMVFDQDDNILCKMKSPFYLIVKMLARGISKLDKKIEESKKNVDEEYYPLLDYIDKNKSIYNKMEEEDRVNFLTDFIKNNFAGKEIKENNVRGFSFKPK